MEVIIIIGLIMSILSNYAFLHVLMLCLNNLDRLDFKNQMMIILLLVCSIGGLGASVYSFVKVGSHFKDTQTVQAEANP